MNKLLIYLFFLVAGTTLLSAQQMDCYLHDDGAGSREHVVDMEKMTLEVSFVPEKGLVKGLVTHQFKPIRKEVDSIFLNGPGIDFKEVKLDDNAVKYHVSKEGITILPDSALKWETEHTISIKYEATPRKGIYFVGWNDPQGKSRKQIWTQGEGIDNRYWVPCYDSPNDKLLTEVKVTFDDKYQVLSNGEKVSERDNRNEGTKTWDYKISKPHSVYLVMLAIGKYGVEKRTSTSGVPIYLYYYPDEKNRVEPTYRYMVKIFDFLEKETGVPYPWKRYSQVPVQNFLYGAMENTTATIYGDFYFNDSRGFLDKPYVNVNAHELTHHWFGDDITNRSNENIWLHESFATHYAKLCERAIYGEDQYQARRKGEMNSALSASENERIPIMNTHAGVSRIYPKGSLVLDMLKYVIGRDEYNKAVKYYLEKHAYSCVTTYDFSMAFQDVLGVNLDWFFDEWIYRGGEPHYEVSYEDIKKGKKDRMTELTVKQIQEIDNLVGYFKMPVEIEVHYTNGKYDSKKVWIDGPSKVVSIPNTQNKDIDFVIFDPNDNIIKRLTFKRSNEELIAQAEKAPNMIDRYDALLALHNVDMDKKKDALLDIYNNEDFYLTKAEIVKQLANEQDDKSIDLLNRALRDSAHEVRAAVLENVDEITQPLKDGFVMALSDSSYHNINVALRKLCTQYPSQIKDFIAKTENVKGLDNQVWISRLEFGTKIDHDRNLRELIQLTTNAYEFRTRINAIEALKRLNYFDDRVLTNLVNAILDPNRRLSTPAGQVLKYFSEQSDYKAMIKKYIDKNNFEDWQKSLLEKFVE